MVVQQKIPLSVLEHLASAPRGSLSIGRRRGDVKQWRTCSCPNFFEMCCRHQIQNLCVFSQENNKVNPRQLNVLSLCFIGIFIFGNWFVPKYICITSCQRTEYLDLPFCHERKMLHPKWIMKIVLQKMQQKRQGKWFNSWAQFYNDKYMMQCYFHILV